MSITQRGTALYAADGVNGDLFGTASAIASSGSIMAVGAPYRGYTTLVEAGGVYIYDWSGSAWVQRGSVIVAPTPADYAHFGQGVALSANGLVLAIGAPGEVHGAYVGVVHIYDWSGSAWVYRGAVSENTATHSYYGQSLALSGNGIVLAVGDYWNAGYYIYDWTTVWTLRGSLLTSPSFLNIGGYGAALSNDGAVFAVGDTSYTSAGISSRGCIEVFDWTTVWTERSIVVASDATANNYLGSAIALNTDGSVLLAGASGASKGYRFTWAPSTWTQVESFAASGTPPAGFGSATALSADGLVAFAGAPGLAGSLGAVYTFDVSAGGTVALAGSAVSVATATGVLSGPVPLSGAAAAVATVTGMLSGPEHLAGASAAVATATGTLTTGKFESITDAISVGEVYVATGTELMVDSTACTEALVIQAGPMSGDTASLADTLDGHVAAIFMESIGLGDTLTAQANTASSLTDSATLVGIIQQAINQLVADTGLGSDTFSLGAALALVDIAQAVDAQAPTYHSVMLVAELIASLELYNSAPGYDITESGTLTDAYTARVSALVALLETAGAVDTDTGLVYITQAASDTASSTEALTTQGLLTALLTDAALVTIRVNIGGETFTGWVLNADTLAPSEYQFVDREFNSACKHGDRYLMATDDGIYEFTEDVGAETVMTYIKTGKTDFGSDLQKRMVNSYMVYSATGNMVLKVTTTEHGHVVTRNYKMVPPSGAVAPDVRRFDLGRGIKSRYWQFELVGDGVDCDIDEIGMLPVVLSRRI